MGSIQSDNFITQSFSPNNHNRHHISRVVEGSMSLLPDTQNCGLRMRWEYRERFSHHRWLAILTCIMERASRTCRDACRYRYLAVSFEVGGGENVPAIPGACATLNFAYLVRGPWSFFVGSLSDLHSALIIMTLYVISCYDRPYHKSLPLYY